MLDAGACAAIAKALRESLSLTELVLDDNCLASDDDRAWRALAGVLRARGGGVELASLSMARTSLSSSGAAALGDALVDSRSLRALDVSGNPTAAGAFLRAAHERLARSTAGKASISMHRAGTRGVRARPGRRRASRGPVKGGRPRGARSRRQPRAWRGRRPGGAQHAVVLAAANPRLPALPHRGVVGP